MKCNQSGPGFELVSPCPYPAMITITPQAPPLVIVTLYVHSSSHRTSHSTSSAWIESVTARKPYIWQQNSAPCPTSWRKQCWLWENFCDPIIPNICPPNTSDSNLRNYYVWSIVEREVSIYPSAVIFHRLKTISTYTLIMHGLIKNQMESWSLWWNKTEILPSFRRIACSYMVSSNLYK